MSLDGKGRFISDAFLRVLFSNLILSKVVHFVLTEKTFNKYCMFSNKHLGTY